VKPPIGKDWIHEIKHDGFRLLARREGTRVRLFTRNGNDWSDRFPSVVEAIEVLKIRSCLIHGELVMCDERALAVFELLRNGRQVKREEAHLIAFDLVELDGRDLTAKPLQLRKAELGRILRGADAGLQLCEHIDQPGNVVFAQACQLGCEGIVSTRVTSRARPNAGTGLR
jgi:bifunctional non-homologous end joining protein LigD